MTLEEDVELGTATLEVDVVVGTTTLDAEVVDEVVATELGADDGLLVGRTTLVLVVRVAMLELVVRVAMLELDGVAVVKEVLMDVLDVLTVEVVLLLEVLVCEVEILLLLVDEEWLEEVECDVDVDFFVWPGGVFVCPGGVEGGAPSTPGARSSKAAKTQGVCFIIEGMSRTP